MSIKILITLLLSIISAIAYRAGGSGNYPRWLRPAVCSAVVISVLTLFFSWHWILILIVGLQYGSLTTYFKKKGTDAKWWNWALVGLIEAIAIFPLMFFVGHWIGFGIRVFLLSVTTTVWSVLIGNDVAEESGRGALLILTMPVLLI